MLVNLSFVQLLVHFYVHSWPQSFSSVCQFNIQYLRDNSFDYDWSAKFKYDSCQVAQKCLSTFFPYFLKAFVGNQQDK